MSSRLKIRRELWKWSIIETKFQRIFESHAESRSLDQRNDLIIIARNRLDIIIIIFIENDKNLLFVIFSQLLNIQIIVIIISFITLKQDLIRRCMKWNILYVCYDLVITS